MFGLFKKKNKNIDTSKINNFNKALKVIEDFIDLEDFQKANLALNEIKEKENDSFQKFIEGIKENEKKKEIDLFKKNISKIDKLKEKLDKKKDIYEKNFKNKKKDIEKKEIERNINDLIGKKDFLNAGNLINDYLEKNQNNIEVIKYVNKKRKELTNLLEKQKKIREKEIKNDAILEAKILIGELQYTKEEQESKEKKSFFDTLKSKFNIKRKIKEKRLLEEVTLLIENKNTQSDLLAKTKLEQIHLGLSKEISNEKINGYELYGKILGADKISGDAIGYNEGKDGYNFFIGDATGHGIRAGIIVSNLTKKFTQESKKGDISDIAYNINNALKQDLKSGNFITSIFFNIQKENTKEINIIGMGHEPIFIYRKNKKEIEKIIPGGLAAGIRIMKNLDSIKRKNIILEDGDILLTYTDGIIEAKNENSQMYSIDRIGKKFLEFAQNEKSSIETIYKNFQNDLKTFTGGKTNYQDDVTILLLKRDKNKEILKDDTQIQEIIKKEGLSNNYKSKIKGKTIDEISEEIKKVKNDAIIKNILKSLENLYKAGEMTKLKQDSIRYIKDGFIHKDINFYLKKAIDNENIFRIKQKEKKIQDKYNVLKELYKKGDYDTVIVECTNIISKDGNI